MLNESPSLEEILWNFRRIKDKRRRLTLKQNPHFYIHLPRSPDAYGGEFNLEPIENFQHPDKFYVLTDRPGLVYINTGQYSRCFGNFWCPNGAIIFKGSYVMFLISLFYTVSDGVLPDLCGRLEGETIVKASLESTLWRFCTQSATSTSPRLRAPGHGRSRRPTLLLECPCEIWIHQIGSLRDSDDVNFGVCAGRSPMNSQVR